MSNESDYAERHALIEVRDKHWLDALRSHVEGLVLRDDTSPNEAARAVVECLNGQGVGGLAMERMPWDQYFLAICDVVKLRSIDKDTQVGCVIVNEHRRIVSTGYNSHPVGVDDKFWPRDRETTVKVLNVGAPRDYQTKPDKLTSAMAESCYWMNGGHYDVDKYMPITHAEMNAVVAAGQDLHGCCIYTPLFPCHECAKAIITSGIKRVVYSTTRENISWAVAKELFIQAGVEMDEVLVVR